MIVNECISQFRIKVNERNSQTWTCGEKGVMALNKGISAVWILSLELI